MSDMHPFPLTDAAQAGLYPDTESPMLWCAPGVTARDKDGRVRYPRLFTRWNCPECQAGWEFTQTTTGLGWRLVGLPATGEVRATGGVEVIPVSAVQLARIDEKDSRELAAE